MQQFPPHQHLDRGLDGALRESRIGTPFNGALACDNVERTYEELKARGVPFEAPPQKQPWGTFAVFKDPDGNQFVLSSK